jgi:hypothetical protein
MVVFAVDISRRMMELRRTSLQCGRRTLQSQQCNSINGMARLTSRQGHLQRSGSELCWELCDDSGIWIEEFASLKHRVHNNRQLARHGYGSSFEADPRPWLTGLLARRPTKVAAIALANKIARMAWAMMARGERYKEPIALAA